MIILKENNFDYTLVPVLLRRLQIANSVIEIINTLKGKSEFETKIEEKGNKERIKNLNIDQN